MQKKRLMLNTMTSIIYQVITVICGLILPRFILNTYGSDVNGLVNSIAQFLGFIAFFELGVGAVIQSALYKPLAEHNNEDISKIVVSGERFFRALARALIIYIVILIFLYPSLINDNFDFLYTTLLIIAMGINSFAQYYFGNINRLLITADQQGYIFSAIAGVTLLLNTVVSVFLMRFGFSIQVVKLSTSVIYLCRPLLLSIYVKRHYLLDRKIKYSEEPIKQKRNGIAQHLAVYVMEGTDSIVLTIFSTLENVSIYSVYSLVVNGVKTLLTMALSGFEAMLGELWAKQRIEELNNWFGWFEWFLHSIVTVAFGCCTVLILPFVRVYTLGINDANYIVPIFAFLISVAYMIYCYRLPYNILILIGNKYKDTQNIFIVSAGINIIVSILMVNVFGLSGVAVGTIIAMAYQTVRMAIYVSKNLNHWPIKKFAKQLSVDVIIFVISYLITYNLKMNVVSYMGWVWLAVKVSIVWFLVCLSVNIIFYRNYIIRLKNKIKFKFRKVKEL